MAVTFRRGGLSTRYWYGSERGAKLEWEPGEVIVRLSMASKGGGTTVVRVSIDQDSFAELAAAMLEAAPQEAIRAFGAALADFPSGDRGQG